METKFTKGSWKIQPYAVVNMPLLADTYFESTDKVIGLVFGHDEKAMANSKLIAAAPELFEVCNEILNLWHSKESNMYKKEPAYMEQIRKALNKATA